MAAAAALQPQPGFQYDALATSADIAILGGAAGAGKSFVLLLESTRNIRNKYPDFGGVIFRRTSPQIRNKGGLWDASKKVYGTIPNSNPREHELEWRFPQGQSLKFTHLQHDKDVDNHQGAEYPFIGFDELCHFSEYQFFYMLSRNRSTCGVQPYVRATCNPDPDSWVATFIEWWIDQDTGFPIADRAGVLRYMCRIGENIVWGDTKQEVYDQVCTVPEFMEAMAEAGEIGIDWRSLIKSVTFIPGTIYQNRKLLGENPGYLGNLLALDQAEQAQLLRGNWKFGIDGMSLFDRLAVNNMGSNYLSTSGVRQMYITCDASRFGRDFTVIFVWRGWEVMRIVIWRKTETHEIVTAIEKERRYWGVPKGNVLVDQDGVGGHVVGSGQYRGFSGGAAAISDIEALVKERYENLKTQCAYRAAAENVNVGEILISLHMENVFVDGVRSATIKVGSKIVKVYDLVRADLMSMKKRARSNEQKLQMNEKDEQKIMLSGRSPDFGDNIIMRKWFDIALHTRSISQR